MPVQKRFHSTINKAYEGFFVSTDRYSVLYGGSGSGKSQAAAQKVVMRCMTETGTSEEPFSHIITVMRKYKTTIRGTVFEQLKGELVRMGIDEMVTINESYGIIKFPWTGAEIRCIGLDDPEKIKSIVSTSAWLEEATEFDEADFKQIDLRFRGEAQYYKQIILTFNPINESHWLKKRFFDQDQLGMTFILHTTYLDNFFLDAQYKKVLEESVRFDENMYRIYVKGEWGRIRTGAEFYFNFKAEKHVKEIEFTPGLPLHISFDFNVNPYITCSVHQIIRREIKDDRGNIRSYFFVNTIDEIALPNPYNTTEQLCDDVLKRHERNMGAGIFIYGDATGKNTSTKSNVSDYDIIKHILGRYMSNFSMRVPKTNPMIKQRRNFVNKLLYGGFNVQWRIHPKCKKLIEDLESCIEAADGGIHKQTARDAVSNVVYEKFGHMSDNATYFLCSAFEPQFKSMIR